MRRWQNFMTSKVEVFNYNTGWKIQAHGLNLKKYNSRFKKYIKTKKLENRILFLYASAFCKKKTKKQEDECGSLCCDIYNQLTKITRGFNSIRAIKMFLPKNEFRM